MSKVPKGISIQKVRSSVIITTSNYSDSLYLIQVMLFIPFLSIVSLVFIVNSPAGLLFSLPLLAMTFLWIRNNKKDHYRIQLDPKRVVITKGINKSQIINIELKDIEEVYINQVHSPIIGAFGHHQILDNKNELIIQTKSDKVLITNSLIDSEQVFIKNEISNWIKLHYQTLTIAI